MTRRMRKKTPEGTRHCPKCDLTLALEQFGWANKEKGKRRSICVNCRNHQRWLHRRFRQEAEQIKIKQGNRCAICKVDASVSPLYIDHDHTTHEIRGLLCHECNSGIAYFDENTEYLAKAMIYLIGGRNEKAFTVADTDPLYDFVYYGGVAELRQTTDTLQRVSVLGRTVEVREQLETRSQITNKRLWNSTEEYAEAQQEANPEIQEQSARPD